VLTIFIDNPKCRDAGIKIKKMYCIRVLASLSLLLYNKGVHFLKIALLTCKFLETLY